MLNYLVIELFFLPHSILYNLIELLVSLYQLTDVLLSMFRPKFSGFISLGDSLGIALLDYQVLAFLMLDMLGVHFCGLVSDLYSLIGCFLWYCHYFIGRMVTSGKWGQIVHYKRN